MQGLEEDTDDEDGDAKRKKRQTGGDDLEDDFIDEDSGNYWAGLGAGLDGGSAKEGSEEEEEDGDDDDEDSSEGDEQEEDGGIASEYSESEGEGEGEEGDAEELVNLTKKLSRKSKSSPGKKDLPFTFPCPTSHDEFLEIVEDIDVSDVPTVVKRIRTLHHPSLAQENKFKLQVWYLPPRFISIIYSSVV